MSTNETSQLNGDANTGGGVAIGFQGNGGLSITITQNNTNPHALVKTPLKTVLSKAKLPEVPQTPKPRQMDGGIRAWLIVLSSFLCNGIIFGVINSYSLIYVELEKTLTENGETDPNSKAALVGSLTIGTTFLLSPVAGVLSDKIGIRWTAILGGFFTTSGMLISSFCYQNIYVLYLSYGIMYGLGAAFTYSPSLAILGQYFQKYLGKVSGFVTAGSSVFTAITPFALNWALDKYGLQISLRFMALFSSLIFLCAILYEAPQQSHTLIPAQPQRPHKIGETPLKKVLKSMINVDIWTKKKYVIWTLALTVSQFGYFVPYVHMSKFVNQNFPGSSSNVAVMCIGISSGLGRIIFGFISDLPKINRILLQQFSVILIGIMTMLLPITNYYALMLCFILSMGLFDGCFVALIGPIAVDICGVRGASQAIGFMLGLFSIPLTVGPPITGLIYDYTMSYTFVFIAAGLSPIIGGILMFLTRCVAEEPNTAVSHQETGTRLAKPAWRSSIANDSEALERKASLASAESLSDENDI